MMRRLRTRMSEQGGFSLPELLVSITLMAIISVAVATSVVAVNRSLGTANATMRDVQSARNAVERVGQLLRGAVAIDGDLARSDSAVIQGSPTDVTFYTLTATDPSNDENPIRFRLRVDTGTADCPTTCLVEERTDPVPTAGGVPTYLGAAVRRVVVRDLVLDAATGAPGPVFRYWSHFDTGVADDRCGREVIPGPAGLSDVDRRDVDSMSFTIVVREDVGYESSPSTLRGWARFASTEDLGFSGSFDSAGCLDAPDGGFGYDH